MSAPGESQRPLEPAIASLIEKRKKVGSNDYAAVLEEAVHDALRGHENRDLEERMGIARYAVNLTLERLRGRRTEFQGSRARTPSQQEQLARRGLVDPIPDPQEFQIIESTAKEPDERSPVQQELDKAVGNED